MRIDEYSKTDTAGLSSFLRESAKNMEASQTASLFDILADAKDTEYGLAHDFAGIKSVEEFRQKVPVKGYSDFKPYIDRMFEGEEGVLFAGRPVSFVFSSGTTGDAKTFPESRAGDEVKRLISRMRSAEISRMLEGKRTKGYKIFAITNSSNFSVNKAGIPVGSASGLTLAQSSQVSEVMSVPTVFSQMGYLCNDEQNYCYAYFALADENVQELVCNNIAHFIKILDLINAGCEKLLSDVEAGVINAALKDEDVQKLGIKPRPERAAYLRKIFADKGKLDVIDIWPRFVCAGCWLSSSVGRFAKEYRDVFPEGTVFIHWGYGASESKFDVPVEPGKPDGIPVAFGSFLELRDLDDGSIILLHEAEPERLYELIVTSYSGLYRYDLHDIVRMSAGSDGLPRIEFICKSKDKVTYKDKVLYAGQLTKMVEDYEDRMHTPVTLFQGRMNDKGLELFIEPKDDLDLEAFESFMRGELEKAGIVLDTVTLYEKGHRNSLFEKVIEGKSLSATKLPVFI